MPASALRSISLNVHVQERMARHPGVNWSAVCNTAIYETLQRVDGARAGGGADEVLRQSVLAYLGELPVEELLRILSAQRAGRFADDAPDIGRLGGRLNGAKAAGD
jgi:hypothetical protein